MMYTPKQQRRHIAKLQRGWAASAFRDQKYNLHRAHIEQKKGNRLLAGAYRMEALWDRQWGNRRLRIARKNLR